MEWRDDDLAIQVRGEWFYWAKGRLLPEGERNNWQSYDPYMFYTYPKTILPIPEYSEAEKQHILNITHQQDINPIRRHPGFFNTLWRVYDCSTSYERVKTIFFLGRKVDIHRELLEDLSRVEEEILEKAKSDADLNWYIKNLWQITGYNWRVIAGTLSLSFHAYGLAVDLLPMYYAGKQVYWRWTREYYPEWFSIPHASRYFPPDAVIKAFENHGFIWGGKWLRFDNIHFEYRPEILILNGFTINGFTIK